MFIGLLPKEQGYLSLLLQVQHNDWLITSIDEYQKLGAQARPYMMISFYTEFADDKRIVLLRGHVDQSLLSLQEAQAVLNVFQIYYLDDAVCAVAPLSHHAQHCLTARVARLRNTPNGPNASIIHPRSLYGTSLLRLPSWSSACRRQRMLHRRLHQQQIRARLLHHQHPNHHNNVNYMFSLIHSQSTRV
jgi:hypothetical protein